ncbi:hypothetical protein ABZ468_29590 [Streptomyces sp. NPDC005708]
MARGEMDIRRAFACTALPSTAAVRELRRAHGDPRTRAQDD